MNTNTENEAVIVSEEYVTGPAVFKVDGSIDGYFKLTKGIYFAGKFRMIFYYNFPGAFFMKYPQLQINDLNLDLNKSTNTNTYDYSISMNSVASLITKIGSESIEGTNYQRMATCIFEDDLYVFLLDQDFQKIICVKFIEDNGLQANVIADIWLPHKAYFFSAEVVNGKMNLFYSGDDGNPSIGYSIIKVGSFENPDSITIESSSSFQVDGGPTGSFKMISSSSVPVGGTLLCGVDGDNNTYAIVVKDYLAVDVQPKGTISPALIDFPAIYAGNGPLLKVSGEFQQDLASAVFLTLPIGGVNATTYIQSPLNNLGDSSNAQVLGQDAVPTIIEAFAEDVFVPLPGTNDGSLFRAMIYGVINTNNGNTAVQLYALASGSLIYQGETIVDTAQTDFKKIPLSKPREIEEQRKKLNAFHQAWTLVGVIQGLPPYPYNGQTLDTPPEVTITFDKTKSITVSQSFKNTIMAGGSGTGSSFNLGGSISHAIMSGVSTNVTLESGTVIPFTGKGRPPSERNYNPFPGLLIFNQPQLKNKRYRLYAPDGIDTEFDYYFIEFMQVNMSFVDYDTVHPDNRKPIANDPYAPMDYSFSKGLTPLPKGDELNQWTAENLQLPSLPKSVEYDLDMITATRSGGQHSTLSKKTEIEETHSSETTIKIDSGITAGIFGFNASFEGTWTFKTELDNSIKKAYQASIPAIKTHHPVEPNDITKVSLQPYIFKLSAAHGTSEAGLVPDYYVGSSPWLITWRVVDYDEA